MASMLDITDLNSPPKVFFKTTNLLLLPGLVAASILILFASLVLPRLYRFLVRRIVEPLRDRFAPYQALPDEDEEVEDVPPPPTPLYAESQGLMADFKAHIRSLREYGTVLFALEVLRTLCLATLLGLSIYAAIQAEIPAESSSFGYDSGDSDLFEILKKKKKKHGGKKHRTHDRLILGEYSNREIGEFGACTFYVSQAEDRCQSAYASGLHLDGVLPLACTTTGDSVAQTAYSPPRHTSAARMGTVRLSRPVAASHLSFAPHGSAECHHLVKGCYPDSRGCCHPTRPTPHLCSCRSGEPYSARPNSARADFAMAVLRIL